MYFSNAGLNFIFTFTASSNPILSSSSVQSKNNGESGIRGDVPKSSVNVELEAMPRENRLPKELSISSTVGIGSS